MKLFIPPLGTKLTLQSDWEFDLYNEYRNKTLMRLLGDTRETKYWNATAIKATLPAGTVLTVSRIYIRQGQRALDSVTFTMVANKRTVRFWAKLDDVNQMEIV